ncbi:copper resistance CopC family protein [Gordonia soli]|uniref:Putative copper resistance protein n=1 Tax=Gordonia soli NBRC 108243 TaxID=1223545 RepID=M0QIM0_9ACTN|nr:copper resistance CopC family protein [Gordonia soli]GAC68378.1 putative copper resistance protein [Gordonia soli NBRC 108243]
MRSRRIAGTALLGAILVAILGSWTAPMAAAHSRPESSVPADGARVEAGPQQVSITFNESLQKSFAVLNVVGPDDRYWQDGDPIVEGPTIRAALRPLGPAGTYKINYRVTSADGHPVEGQRTFELTTAGTGTPGPAVADAQESDESGVPLWPFIVGAVVVLGGGLGVVLWVTRRSPGRS